MTERVLLAIIALALVYLLAAVLAGRRVRRVYDKHHFYRLDERQ